MDKLSLDFPALSSDLRLQVSVKAMNDSLGPEGLVPILLVFGVQPRLDGVVSFLTSQSELMAALQLAKLETDHVSAELSLRRALHKNNPRAAHRVVTPGKYVLFFGNASIVLQGRTLWTNLSINPSLPSNTEAIVICTLSTLLK
jgi:hypothetical protein